MLSSLKYAKNHKHDLPHPHPFSTSHGTDHPTCYDYQLKPQFHDLGQQRYVSPTTGKCRRLKVQSAEPRIGEVKITSNVSRLKSNSLWLCTHRSYSINLIFEIIYRWLWFLVLVWYSLYDEYNLDPSMYTGYYKAYPMEFWGQLWDARSEKEYSLRMNGVEQRRLPLRANGNDSNNTLTHLITHALYPRQLIVYDPQKKRWSPATDSKTLIRIDYIAISYRQTDFPDKDKLVRTVQEACLGLGFQAYWLDFQCTGKTPEDKNKDLYRIADVFRGATKTLIMIAGIDDEPQSDGWVSWGDRVWTLPEALLSAILVCKVGDKSVRDISLRQVANFAYREEDEEMRIVNGFSGKDQLERLEKLSLLKDAIWRRSSGPEPGVHEEPDEKIKVPGTRHPGSEFTAYPAEKVYALMGFFDRRILPDRAESELQALARLSMANDSNRIAERMVSMLPEHIDEKACWYSDHDLFNSKLWDIEPEVQAVGTSENGALVLDGCRAACIRWKGFPEVVFDTKFSLRRWICSFLPYLFFGILIAGLVLLRTNRRAAIICIAVGAVALLAGPFCIVYSDSGRILDSQPWMIGVRGVLSAHRASILIYGEDSTDPSNPRISYSSAGSLLSKAEHGPIRQGDSSLSEAIARDMHQKYGNIYTLIDTCSDTIYHFAAQRPPTVCVFTGREGGMGRCVLCSETCQTNELHKEAVLRMPSYIARSMKSTGWLAVGGVFDTKNR